MYDAKAYAVASPTSPFVPTTIARRDPTPHDVRIEILFCGVCHSEPHAVSAFALIFGNKSLSGSLIGGLKDT